MRPVVTVRESKVLRGPQTVATDLNDHVFVTEVNPSTFNPYARISVFSLKGEFLTSFIHQDTREPHGVAIHGDNPYYVTNEGEDSIFHFKIETDFPLVAMRGSKGQQIGEFLSS